MVPTLRTIAGNERDDVVRLCVEESIGVVEGALFLSSSGVIMGPSLIADIDIISRYMC